MQFRAITVPCAFYIPHSNYDNAFVSHTQNVNKLEKKALKISLRNNPSI